MTRISPGDGTERVLWASLAALGLWASLAAPTVRALWVADPALPRDPHPVAAPDTVLDFERLPDGTPACDRCPVTSEFASVGVRLAFRSPFVRDSAAMLVGSGAYDPSGEEENHSVTAYLSDRGFFPGVLVLRFPGAPERVVFRLRGPASVRSFEIRVYPESGAAEPLPGSAVERLESRTYGASRGGLFREEIIRLQSGSGIARVELDGTGPPGHILLVDDLGVGRVDRADPR